MTNNLKITKNPITEYEMPTPSTIIFYREVWYEDSPINFAYLYYGNEKVKTSAEAGLFEIEDYINKHHSLDKLTIILEEKEKIKGSTTINQRKITSIKDYEQIIKSKRIGPRDVIMKNVKVLTKKMKAINFQPLCHTFQIESIVYTEEENTPKIREDYYFCELPKPSTVHSLEDLKLLRLLASAAGFSNVNELINQNDLVYWHNYTITENEQAEENKDIFLSEYAYFYKTLKPALILLKQKLENGERCLIKVYDINEMQLELYKKYIKPNIKNNNSSPKRYAKK